MAFTGAVALVLCLLSASLAHPYGPASSSHHQQQQSSSASSYQASGNDQLRFHPEESQYFSNEPQPAPNHAAPSYADLVNLATQEAQQQAIIEAQKKLETNKIVKDIEFIQKQQDMLQAQIREQEIKNEQKLNNPGSYSSGQSSSGSHSTGQGSSGSYGSGHKSTGSYGSTQNSQGGTFNNGQWVPDGNANKFDDGLYKGDGGYGSSGGGGGTPGVSFPEYQPSDVERVPCAQPGYTCVAKHLCVNGKVNNNGIGIIQLRISMKSCRADIEVCCQEDESPQTGGYGQPPKPASGHHQPVDSYGQPTDAYESCNVCGNTGNTGSYSHQQHHSQESASYHKETSSSLSQGSNLPRAQLPDFVPPSATATLPLLKQSHSPSAGGYGK